MKKVYVEGDGWVGGGVRMDGSESYEITEPSSNCG